MLICSRSTRRTTSRGSTNATRSGKFSMSSLMRASNLTVPTNADLETKVAQSGAEVILNSDSLRLQQFAVGQQHPQFLTAERLHMHRAIKPDPHHLRYAAGVVAVSFVDLCLQHRPHVPCLNTDHRQACFGEGTEQPLRGPASSPIRLKW